MSETNKKNNGYLSLYASGELNNRIDSARAGLENCCLCPRRCKVNRLDEEKGKCNTGSQAIVASYAPHFGEESPLVGSSGSGTIFFSHCNLLCLFCQNYEISHLGEGVEVTPGQLAAVMMSLQKQGCHNINFVTPSHVVPQILEALPIAIEKGLTVPLVYNSSGYDSVETLKLLNGVIDIYMPDFKFWDPVTSKRYAKAKNYSEKAQAAIKEMYMQVGDLLMDMKGVAVKGLLVRHLVMPEGLVETENIISFIAKEISTATYINIMDQYRPCGQARHYPPLHRRITQDEYLEALRFAKEAGLNRLDDRDWPGILKRLGLT